MRNKYTNITNHFYDTEVKKQSKLFLDNFWLTEKEFQDNWLKIKNHIFNSVAKNLPDKIFNNGYEEVIKQGGVLFTQAEYEMLQECMKKAGDKYFIILENSSVRKIESGQLPHLQFKFPVNTTWEELNNGDEHFPDISYELLWVMNKDFYVFGDSALWGKYSAIDYFDTPFEILGFKQNISSCFRSRFKQENEIYGMAIEDLKAKFKITK
jgi:hypothetical protein